MRRCKLQSARMYNHVGAWKTKEKAIFFAVCPFAIRTETQIVWASCLI